MVALEVWREDHGKRTEDKELSDLAHHSRLSTTERADVFRRIGVQAESANNYTVAVRHIEADHKRDDGATSLIMHVDCMASSLKDLATNTCANGGIANKPQEDGWQLRHRQVKLADCTPFGKVETTLAECYFLGKCVCSNSVTPWLSVMYERLRSSMSVAFPAKTTPRRLATKGYMFLCIKATLDGVTSVSFLWLSRVVWSPVRPYWIQVTWDQTRSIGIGGV